MASPGDVRAGRILLALAVAGALVRMLGRDAGPPGGVAFRAAPGVERPARDSVVAEARRVAQPLRRGERIDPNRATATELVRLPRIGPALAARIIQFRDSAGPGAFQSIADLERVPGIGAGLARALIPYVTVGRARATQPVGRRTPARVALNSASAEEIAGLPGIGPVRARAIVEDRNRRGPFRDLSDLTRVKGIGPATIARLRARVRVP